MPRVRCAAQFVPLADIFFTDISKLFRLVYQKGAKNATWHFNKLGPWANWMSGSLQSLIQHQKQLLWEFPLSNFYQFRPFTPKWNLRLLPSSLNFLNISGSFKCYRGGRKTFSRGEKTELRKKNEEKKHCHFHLEFVVWPCFAWCTHTAEGRCKPNSIEIQ